MINRTVLMSALAALVFAVAALLHPPGRAYACSCLVPPPAGEARDQSAAVFSGQVSRIIRQTDSSHIEVEFQVAESWKGSAGPTLRVRTATSSAACGYEFVEGERYLVYANEQDGNLAVNLCSRTAALGDASADLQALGPGQAAPQAPASGAPQLPTLPLLLTIAGIAVAGAAAIVIVRRRAA